MLRQKNYPASRLPTLICTKVRTATALLSRAALAIAILTVIACGEDSSEQHIAQARDFLANADYDSASIELKNALRKDASSAEGRWLLGKLYMEAGDVQSAEKELLRARELNWNKNDVDPLLAKALLAQDRFVAVRELPHKDLKPEAAATLLATKSLAELGQGELEEARKLIDEALEESPGLLEAEMVLARVLSSEGRLTDSLSTLEDILGRSPELAEAWRLKGEILLRQQRLHPARDAFDQSIALSKNDFADRMKRALINLLLGQYDASQEDVNVLLEMAPQHPSSNYVQGLLHFQRKKYRESITALYLAMPASQQFPLIPFYLGSAHLLQGQVDEAAQFADRFFDYDPDNINGRKLLATTRLMQGDYGDVQELLQPVLDNDPQDITALNLMANALLRDEKTDQAIALFERIATLQPDSPVAQIKLGAGLLMAGQGEEATQHIEAALELNPEYQQAAILLVMNHARKGEMEAAIQAAEAYRRHNPVSTTPLNLLGKVYLTNNQSEEAKASFEKALSLEPGDAAANHYLAQMAIAEGDLATARKHYQVILEQDPDSLPALLQLAELDKKEQKEPAMRERLEYAISAHPKAIKPRLILGSYYLSKGEAEQVPLLFSTLDDFQKRSPQVLKILALAQLAEEQHSDARYTLEQLASLNPNSSPYHHLLAMNATGSGDNERAKAELQRALALDKNYLPSLIALARIALIEHNTAAFDQYLYQLVDVAPDSPDVLRLRAVAARRNGDLDTAIKFAAQAHTASPDTQSMTELAAYLRKAGRQQEARQLQEAWVTSNPDDVVAKIDLAGSFQRDNMTEEAKSQYQAVLQIDKDNLVALNNLAWYLRLEDREKALQYIQRASELAPEQPEILDSLAVIESLNGMHQEAKRSIERALERSPDNPSMLYHRAMIDAALDERSAAISTLVNLLANDSIDFPERAEAEALLKSLRG